MNSSDENSPKSPYEYNTKLYLELLKGFPFEQSDPRTRKKIAILGAGMAGLVSGWLLKKAGHNITIFEASNVVGGRVKTLRDRFSSGFYAEAGAMRIPNHHEITLWIIEELLEPSSLMEFPNYCPNAYYHINNRQVSMGYYEANPDKLGFRVEPQERKKTAVKLLAECLINYVNREKDGCCKELIEELDAVVKKLDAISGSSGWSDTQCNTLLAKIFAKIDSTKEIFEEIDTYSLRQFLRMKSFTGHPKNKKEQKPLSQAAADHICSVLALDMSLSASMAAVLRIFNNIYYTGVRSDETKTNEKKPAFYQIDGGMDCLPKALARLLESASTGEKRPLGSCKILYNSRVTEIKHKHGRGVGITYQNTIIRTPLSELFDLAVIAIPFSALRHVRIGCATPEKRRALRQLHYDNACKIILEFEKPFWCPEITGGKSITNMPIRQIYYPNPKQNYNRLLLASYTWGEDSWHWTALPHDDRLLFALRDLAQVHEIEDGIKDGKGLASSFIGGMSHNWVEDENSSGAFAVFEPYQGGRLFPDIWRPEYRLHYCGEHTSTKHGWIEGAVESGVRVANEICRRIKGDPELKNEEYGLALKRP